MTDRRSDPPPTPEHIHDTQRNNDTPGGDRAFLRRLTGPQHVIRPSPRDLGVDGNFLTPTFNRRDSIYSRTPPPVNRQAPHTSAVPLLPPSMFTPPRRGARSPIAPPRRGARSPIERILSEHQHQQATDTEARILQIELNYVRGQVAYLEERLREIHDNQHRSPLRVESPSDFRNENGQDLFKPLIHF